ncbi:helix-turn-helix domain-containing protein [Duganella sp. LjRoot269]|uniref:AraC family transcriptional regulator n=1 Tax=Duganella sp. LjRoot269 TaxID=3342305 RepID=UPI003ECEB5B9
MTDREDSSDIAIWHAPELKAELLRGRFVDFSYDVHTHETACFALLTHGAIRIRMRGSEFVARQGDLYAIDADEAHAGWPVDDGGWRQRTLYVDMLHLRRLAGEEHAAHARPLAGPIIRDAGLADALYTMHRCSQEQGPTLLRDQAYLNFAAGLTGRYLHHAVTPPDAGTERAAIRSAREFLDQHLDDQVSLEDIAAAAGLPAFQLFRAFERALGMTPHAYQRQARVRLAIQLIRRGHALVEAGVMSGFSDQAHLTRWFRRFMGVTPGQYQRAVLGKAAR